jgi:hypothetical protein
MPVPTLPDKETSTLVSSRQTFRVVHYFIVLLGCLAFTVLGVHRESRVFHFRDFKQPYASARCLLFHCNPYSEQDTQAEYLSTGGPNNDALVFVPYSALYPPPALLLLAPVAALPYPAAHAVWMALLIVGFTAAALLIAGLCEDYGSLLAAIALAFFVGNSDVLIMLGQLSGITIVLICAGLWSMLRGKTIPAIVCIACALCLKPHDTIFFLPYFLLADSKWRKSLAGILGVTAAITMVAVLWLSLAPASSHWMRDLRANVAGNTAPGSVDDPSPSNPQADAIENLQAVFSVMKDTPRFYSTAAYVTAGVLFLTWLYGAIGMGESHERHLLSISFLACLTLLPIYHRQYDSRLLLLVFPAIALLLTRRRAAGILALVLMSVQIIPQIEKLAQHIFRLHPHMDGMRLLLEYRLPQLSDFGLAVLLVVVIVREARAKKEYAEGSGVPGKSMLLSDAL